MAQHVMVVGGLNRTVPYFANAAGIGLTVFWFDDADGSTRRVCEEPSVDNAGFLSVHPRTGIIYVNTEMAGWHEGTVSAYRFDPAAGRLRYLNKHATLGSTAAYNCVSNDGSHLFVANYAMEAVGEGPDRAVVAFPIEPDGRLGPASSSVAHEGVGHDPGRQERAHPHCLLQSPDGRFLLVADLGLDAVLSYRIEAGGRIGRPVARAALSPGSGPRHFLFHPTWALLILVCELDSTLVTFRFHAADGSLEQVQAVSLLPASFSGTSHTADLRLHPDGRTVYASNRGHDSVAVVALDETGALSVLAHHGCGGSTPRNLAIDPSGSFLLVANQDSSRVSVFRLAGVRHEALLLAGEVAVGTPMCIRFLPGHVLSVPEH